MPRRVAVKILHPQHAANPTVRARFKRELEAACRVSHENVVAVYDIGEDPNLGLYYVMELVAGTPLKDYLSGVPLPWPFVYRVALQLTRALHAIHGVNIVHRDLKPQNIMLVERSSLDELVKVLDFGIASLKTADEDLADVELTGARMVLGTPPYMSPEQTYMRSDRERLGLEVDPRSDIYSLGVILYEMAAGRRPFSGDAHDIVVAHRLTRPMPLERMVGVSVPRPFADLVMRCLAKDPKERPDSAKDLAQELKGMEHLPVKRWDVDESPGDPRDVATQMQEHGIPMTVSLPQDTAPRLRVSRPPRPGSLWAPVALLGLIGVLAALALLSPPSIQDADAAVVASAPAVTTPAPPSPATKVSAAHAAADSAPAAARRAAPEATEAAAVPSAPAPARPAPSVGVAPAGGSAEATAAGAAVATPEAPPVAVEKAKVVNIVVTTHPPGATLTLDGEPHGQTPVNLSLPARKRRNVKLEFTMKRYRDHSVTLAIGPELAGKVLVVNEELKRAYSGGAPGASGAGQDPFKDL